MRCGLQILRSCGLAVADFKNYEVADLRLRIQESRKVVADLRLRTKLLNVQLQTCGCGLRKLKFGCGFADCGLKKKLVVPSTGFKCVLYIAFTVICCSQCFLLPAVRAHTDFRDCAQTYSCSDIFLFNVKLQKYVRQ